MSAQLHFDGELKIQFGEHLAGDAKRILLLEKIAEHGSITHAAKAAGVSYKTAWDAVEQMNNLAGEPLVERAAGGKGGGGTALTARGLKLVENFKHIQQEQQKFLTYLSQQTQGLADDYVLLGKLRMHSSARNQFLGEVTRITTGAVNDEIELAITGGHTLTAIITHGSTLNLELVEGVQAYALIKSSSIILTTETGNIKFSARNQFTGTVSRIHEGAVNAEVILDLGGGASIAAIITNESLRQLELTEGQTATALFKSSSVILGR